jgi:hypothetical protein
MRRRDLLLGLGLGLLATASATRLAHADAIAPPPRGESAEIVSIDLARSVIVLRVGRRERTAHFTPLTRVRVAGMLGAVTDLRPGMHVTVHFAASESGRESTTLVSIDA